MFVFDVVQIASGCDQICSWCIAATCNLLATDLGVGVHCVAHVSEEPAAYILRVEAH
jgi:hypothetical protein